MNKEHKDINGNQGCGGDFYENAYSEKIGQERSIKPTNTSRTDRIKRKWEGVVREVSEEWWARVSQNPRLESRQLCQMLRRYQ